MTGLILVAALLLDAALGEPAWLWSRIPHPVVLIGRAIGWADRRFNRGPSPLARGAALAAALVVGPGLVGLGIAALPGGEILAGLAAAILLAQRSLSDHVRAVAAALADGLAEGRAAVGRIVGRDTAPLDGPGVARAAIESAAENFADGVVAPAFWFLILGLPGIMIYKAVNTADSMIGHVEPPYTLFGRPAARLDDALNLVPARLAALLLAAASGRRAAFAAMWADHGLHRSPNAGWPEAAMAGALDVAVAGPRSYGGVVLTEPYMNPGGARDPGPPEIAAAVRLIWRAWILLVLLAAFVATL